MASIISAGTTSGTALNISGDTSGNLAFQTQAGTNTITVPNVTGTLLTTATPGTVIQTVTWTYNPSVQFTMTSNTTYTTFTSAPSASITLTNSANKVLIIARIGMQFDAADQIRNTIYRAISGGSTTDLSNANTYGLSFHGVSASGGLWKESMITYTDSPATSSAVTYTWYSKSEANGLIYPDHGNAANSMVLMEIAV
jgi:hypothetical protein